VSDTVRSVPLQVVWQTDSGFQERTGLPSTDVDYIVSRIEPSRYCRPQTSVRTDLGRLEMNPLHYWRDLSICWVATATAAQIFPARSLQAATTQLYNYNVIAESTAISESICLHN